MKFIFLFFVINLSLCVEDHLDESQMTFLRYVLPDYFSKVNDGDLEVITAYQTDEKLTFNQQKDNTFRILGELNIDEDVQEHFREFYKLEDAKQHRFNEFMGHLEVAVNRYFLLEKQRDITIASKKEKINNLLDDLRKPVSEVLKLIITTLDSSRILNSSRRKTVTDDTQQKLSDL